jgi:hypothetical protein
MKFRILRLLFIAASAAFALSSCRNEDNRIEPTCFDEVKNQGEVGIDCGGPCPDCLPTCDDRVLNGTEQFIDCGGEDCIPCATCLDNIQNAHWKFDPNLTMADFNSNDSVGMAGGVLWRLVLERGVDCGVPCDSLCQATCDDGIQNGDEQGVDCGGTNCLITCFPPTCGDGLQNGQETGIDCGTPGCPDCPTPTCNDGIQNIHIEYIEPTAQNPDGYLVVVETGPDCDGNFQTSCPDCPIPTCFDGLQNGTETGIDCDEIDNNGCPPCDPLPACGNGYQDGDETGVDCDDDPTTICPPCATCADGIQNGPELEIDCVDWPIAAYDNGSCVLCISCHDNEQNQLEQETDCGGPNCAPCEQFMISDGIGQGTNPSGFIDQQTFNAILAAAGQDTISVTANTGPDGLIVEKTQFGLVEYLRATGISEFEIPDGSRFRKTLTLYLPLPALLGENNPINVVTTVNFPPGSCFPTNITAATLPFFSYREELIGANTFSDCYVVRDIEGALPKMRYTYIFDEILSGFYLRGSIDASDIVSDQIIGADITGVSGGISFAFNYPLF